ncbi:MAG: hypothetical protein A2Z88_01035 [Omnitrophica WOR_2 bacterium GWA2_47_8]|nr:MAG: hypothetical protein A2Z88_01035 [Omnitrophica WOR_2 bacterium GWA2_47_8]
MKANESFDNPSNESPHPSGKFLSPSNTIAVYTVLTILKQMKIELGLEAMLEYQSQYLTLLDKNNPHLKSAVNKALAFMCIKKMYKDAESYEKS